MKTSINAPSKIYGKAFLNKRSNCYQHKDCGGDIMFDGIHTKKQVVDLGIAGTYDGALIILKNKITKYVHGGCMKCRKDGLFELSVKFTISSKIKKLIKN